MKRGVRQTLDTPHERPGGAIEQVNWARLTNQPGNPPAATSAPSGLTATA